MNNQDLYVLKDDFSAVFGKHFVKAGAFYSSNAKNEWVNNSSQESVGFGGSSGYMRSGTYVRRPQLRQRHRGPAARGHGLRHGRARRRTRTSSSAGTTSSSTWPTPTRSPPAGRWTSACASATCSRRSWRTTGWATSSCRRSTPPSATPPATASSTRRERTPARLWASRAEATGRTGSSCPTQFLWFAPRLGVAWDVNGNGKMAIRAGIGRFYQRDRVSPGLGVGTSPPFSGSASVTRTLDSAASVTGATAPGYGAASNALEQETANSNYWQWNVAVEKEVWANTKVEVAYVGSKGLDLFGQTNLNEVAPANRLAYAQTGNQALRPLNGTASIGNGNMAMWQHNRDSIYHSLQVAFASRFGNNSVLAASYTWAKLISNTGVGNADGPGLSNQQRLHRQHPAGPRPGAGRQRPHALVQREPRPGPPEVRRQGSLREERLRRLGVHLHRPGGHGLSRSRSTPEASRDSPETASPGNGIRRLTGAAERGRGTELHGGRLQPDPVAQPGCLDAQRLPDRHVRQQRPQHLRRPRPLPGGRFRVQEHQAERAGEAPAPVRGVQPLQPEQLHQSASPTTTTRATSCSTPGPGSTATQIISATPVGNFGQLNNVRDPRTAQVGIRLMF